MPKNLFLLYCLFVAFSSMAQTFESFSDGDFTQLPSWRGTDSLFRINSQLQLQSAGKSSLTPAFLSLPIKKSDSMEWEFWLRFAFNPSSQNQVRYYLLADSFDVSQSKKACYLQFGGSTGTTDSLNLIYTNQGKITYIIRGMPSTLGLNNNIVKVRVNLNQQNQWQVWLDTSQNKDNLIEQGKTVFAIDTGNYFTGLWFKYTIGNASNVYLDDLYAGAIRIDHEAPIMKDFKVTSDSTLELLFDETIDSTKFQVTLSHPGNITYIFQNEIIRLHLNQKLVANNTYRLTLKNLCDNLGNCANDTTLDIGFIQPMLHQVLFTELLPDPSPSVGLPEAEFIEIYNQGNIAIPLNLLSIADEKKIYPLSLNPKVLIEPKTFLILCNTNDSSAFAQLGRVHVTSIPSLTNEGKSLYLLNQNQDTIHSYRYQISSYKNTSKAAGGYTLEMIHPARICQENDNWQASESIFGGTPGQVNSLWHLGTDQEKPRLSSLSFFGSNQIRMIFHKAIDSLLSVQGFCKINNQETILARINAFEYVAQVPIRLEHLKQYAISMGGWSDCSANIMQTDTHLVYYQTKTPGFLEVLINEICFDEKRATTYTPIDFIEIKNRSFFAVNLAELILKVGNQSISLPQQILAPDSLLILYKTQSSPAFIGISNQLPLSNFPSLNLNETVSLLNNNQEIIHQVSYKSTWMSNKLHLNPKAASIELISTNNPCLSEDVWQISLSKDGSTPGKENTQNNSYTDKENPHLNMYCLLNDSVLLLHFNEPMHLQKFRFSDTLIKVNAENNLSKCQLTISKELPFTLEIIDAQDCAGNPLPPTTCLIAATQQASANDIKITEILFDAYPNESDFIELQNTKDYPIYLDNLLLVRKNDGEVDWKEVISLNGPGHCLAAHQTLALHPKPNQLKNTYSYHSSENIFEHPMLSLPLEGGLIEIRDSMNLLIDSASFSEKLHFELLVQTKGISLERQQLFLNSIGDKNWYSSATGASPGIFTNKEKNNTGKGLTATPTAFSPNMDGYLDYIEFNLTPPNTNLWAKPMIVNHHGQVIKQIEPLLMNQNYHSFNWTGTDEQGNLCKPGIYVAILQTQDSMNQREVYRCSFAILQSK
jgi:hypothetical protein